MSRRRQKNSLLPKMIGVAVLVNAVLLPILAHMGVFKVLRGQHLEPVKLVSLPPQKKPPVPKKTARKTPPKKRAARPRPAARAAPHPATARPSRPNPNQPKLVVSAGGGNGGGPSVENNGTGASGQLPSGPAPTANPTPPDTPAPTPPDPTPIVPAPVPSPAPPARTVVTPPPPPAPLHTPVVVAAEPVSQPQPRIPDDLGADGIRGDFKAVFSIRADGSVSVRMTSSTGSSALDGLALDAARRWTFRPATVDGRPVDSFRRFVIQFEPT